MITGRLLEQKGTSDFITAYGEGYFVVLTFEGTNFENFSSLIAGITTDPIEGEITSLTDILTTEDAPVVFEVTNPNAEYLVVQGSGVDGGYIELHFELAGLQLIPDEAD